MHRGLILMLSALLYSGCATPHAGGVRFKNQPIVWSVNDRLDVQQPERISFSKTSYYLNGVVLRPITRAMDVPDPDRALNTNALDEVPDSTWFTNRIGSHQVTVEEIRHGPGEGGGPNFSGPWVVTGLKVGGAAIGLLFADPTGDRYLLKFEPPGTEELETGADVVLQRLLWAIGYNVPEDEVVHVKRDRLVLAQDATVEDVMGNKRPMTQKDLNEEVFGRSFMQEDGRYRALASKLLPGYPIGGFPQEGVREDDANDLFAHEDRREVRGLKVFFAWLGQTDVKEDNTLDMWVEDAENPGQHYVVHNLVDFGKGLGVYGAVASLASDQFAYTADIGMELLSLMSLGLWVRPWEGAEGPGIRGVGRFESERFAMDNWKPRYPYIPFNRTDRFDGYWAAKILMRFTPAHIEAALEQAKYTDQRAVDYYKKTLIRRQRKIGAYWFSRVNPLDQFTMRTTDHGNSELCFQDLMLLHGLGKSSEPAVYEASAYGSSGATTGWRATGSQTNDSEATACIAGIPNSSNADGYTIVRIDTTRPAGEKLPPVFIHLAPRPTPKQGLSATEHGLRIIGVRRH